MSLGSGLLAVEAAGQGAALGARVLCCGDQAVQLPRGRFLFLEQGIPRLLVLEQRVALRRRLALWLRDRLMLPGLVLVPRIRHRLVLAALVLPALMLLPTRVRHRLVRPGLVPALRRITLLLRTTLGAALRTGLWPALLWPT